MAVFISRSLLCFVDADSGHVRRFDPSTKTLSTELEEDDALRENQLKIPVMTEDDKYSLIDEAVAEHETDDCIFVQGQATQCAVRITRRSDNAGTFGILISAEDDDDDEDKDKKYVLALLTNESNAPVPCKVSRHEWGIAERIEHVGNSEQALVAKEPFLLSTLPGFIYDGPKTSEDLLRRYGTNSEHANLMKVLGPLGGHITKHPDSMDDFFVDDKVSFRLCSDGELFHGKLRQCGVIEFRFHPLCVCKTKIAVDLRVKR